MTKDEYGKLVEAGVHKPKSTDPWTDKQLATLRRDCVTIAVDWCKTIRTHDRTVLEFAEELYSYILEHKLPTKGE